MTPSPIRKVLSSMRMNGVQYLLMGGQACVLYGGAEFSRDIDLAILSDADNLQRLVRALNELQAECIAVPPFELRYLDLGLAVHFRCQHPEAQGMRIDVMSRMRGVDDFLQLWQRRTTIETAGETLELLSLPDLVRSKKTQRDKDWPMIKRLLEANYFANRDAPAESQIEFWLSELRTDSLIREVAKAYPAHAQRIAAVRPLVKQALDSQDTSIALLAALQAEEQLERERDAAYWRPLRQELERLRRER